MYALIVVDFQNDFLENGPMPAGDSKALSKVINKLSDHFSCVVASQDWHPENHISFASTHGKKVGEKIQTEGSIQVLWPNHCIQGSVGADFSNQLQTGKIDKIIKKGVDPEVDSYSAFFDNNRAQKTELDSYLRLRGVTDLFICGITLEYCVKYTAIDGLYLGYKVAVISDAVGHLTSQSSLPEQISGLKNEGIKITTSGSIITRMTC